LTPKAADEDSTHFALSVLHQHVQAPPEAGVGKN
jgi:hypothetical protein